MHPLFGMGSLSIVENQVCVSWCLGRQFKGIKPLSAMGQQRSELLQLSDDPTAANRNLLLQVRKHLPANGGTNADRGDEWRKQSCLHECGSASKSHSRHG